MNCAAIFIMSMAEENDRPQVLEDCSNSGKFYILMVLNRIHLHQFSDLNISYNF